MLPPENHAFIKSKKEYFLPFLLRFDLDIKKGFLIIDAV